MYLKADSGVVGFVTSILVNEGGFLRYLIMWNSLEETYHSQFELSDEKAL